MLLGAVGIENDGSRDFKHLRGTQRNTKSLNRSDREREGIDMAP